MGLVGDGTIITLRVISDTAQTQFYTISGYILDGASAGVSGVTITLSGDDYKIDTTDGDGFYSFSTMVDGSYTITPTKTGYWFTADHEDVTVSGANVTVDTMVATAFLTLPYTYSTSDVVQSSGAVAGQLSDWTIRTNGGTFTDGAISTTTADTNSYTPSGVTKVFDIAWDASRDALYKDLPYIIDNSLTNLRVAVLVTGSTGADCSFSFYLNNTTAAELNAQSPDVTGTFGIYWGTVFNPDEIDCASRYEDTTVYTEFNNTSTGRNDSSTRWMWQRFEYDFVAETVKVEIYRVEDTSLFFSQSASMNAAGVSLGHVPSGMKSFYCTQNLGSSTTKLAKIWIGTTSDAWPT